MIADERQLRKSIYRLMLFVACFLSIVLSGSWLMAMRTLQLLGSKSDDSTQKQVDSTHSDSRDKRVKFEHAAIHVIGSDSQETPGSLDTGENNRQQGAASQEPSDHDGLLESPVLSSTRRAGDILADRQATPAQHQRGPAPHQVASAPRQIAQTSPRPLPNGAPQPYYPLDAYRQKKEGSVGLRVWVNAKGMPKRVLVVRSSKFPELDRAAAQAIYDWRFQPATIDGKAAAGQAKVTIDFKMNR